MLKNGSLSVFCFFNHRALITIRRCVVLCYPLPSRNMTIIIITITIITITINIRMMLFMVIRELSFYIISIYLPCSMIVVVSWFSFWIDLNSVSTYQTIPRKWGTMYFRHQPVFPWQSPPYWQCPLRWPAYRWRENSTQN